MAIKFKVYSTPKPNSRKGSKLSHARAISQGTYNLEKVCKLISERSAVSSAEVKSVLDSFAWVIELALEDGCHVELDDLGYFSPSLKTVPSKKDGTKNTVYVDGINYRCSTSLREKLRGIDLTYVKEKKKPEIPADGAAAGGIFGDQENIELYCYLGQYQPAWLCGSCRLLPVSG